MNSLRKSVNAEHSKSGPDEGSAVAELLYLASDLSESEPESAMLLRSVALQIERRSAHPRPRAEDSGASICALEPETLH